MRQTCLPMTSQCFAAEKSATGSAQSHVQAGSTSIWVCLGKQENARPKSFYSLKFAPLSKSIILFKTQTLIGYFLGEHSQYIPHLVGLIVLCMLWLDWCCEPRKRSRRSLRLQMSLLRTTVVVGLPDTWLLQ